MRNTEKGKKMKARKRPRMMKAHTTHISTSFNKSTRTSFLLVQCSHLHRQELLVSYHKKAVLSSLLFHSMPATHLNNAICEVYMQSFLTYMRHYTGPSIIKTSLLLNSGLI